MESLLVPISPSKTQELSASHGLIREWLFRFGVNFEKDVAPVLPLWLEAFGGMKPETLEPLFRRALRNCKFFPRVADILEPLDSQAKNYPVYLGPPLLAYLEITQEERDEALKLSEELKKKLGPPPQKSERPKPTIRPSLLSLQEQKRVLREKGFLPKEEYAETRA